MVIDAITDDDLSFGARVHLVRSPEGSLVNRGEAAGLDAPAGLSHKRI